MSFCQIFRLSPVVPSAAPSTRGTRSPGNNAPCYHHAMRFLLVLTLCAGALPAQEIDFDKQVRPILEGSCYKCHDAKRHKGDLRLDQWSARLAAGEHPVLVPGKPDKSGLFHRVTLDPDDPDSMPESGEPLSKDQIAILKTWIEQGAKWPRTAAADPDAEWNKQFAIGELTDAQKASQANAIKTVKGIGGIAGPIANNTDAIDVNLSLLGAGVTDDKLQTLSGLESSLVWLNLSRTGISDTGLAKVGGHTHLRRLHLARTSIGDAGLAHLKGLTGLQFLNLYGTNVTDAGLAHLSGMKSLKKLFLWQSKVTDAGVEKLTKSLPGVVIDTGKYAKPVVVKVETKPMAVNTKCPITGKPVDAAQAVTFEEQLVAFCCGNCKAAFEKDPGKYADKVEGLKRKPVNAKCPVKGTNVNPDHILVHKGKVVGFCCPNCKAAFAKNPTKFEAKIN